MPMNPLAALFTKARNLDHPDAGEAREAALSALYTPTRRVAKLGKTIAIWLPDGQRLFVQPDEVEPRIYRFTHYGRADRSWEKSEFWMNASSVEDRLDAAEAEAVETPEAFAAIMTCGEAIDVSMYQARWPR